MSTKNEEFNGFDGVDGFRPNELVLYRNEEGKVMSGGYRVNSLLMKGGKSPITSYFKGGSLERRNDLDSDEDDDDANEIVDSKEDNKNKDPFSNLAVPAGILLIVQQPSQSEYDKKSYANEKYRNCDMLSDDIYDKLFEYASFKGKNKGNKNNFKGTNKKITRNNKKDNNELPKKQTKRNKTKI